MGEETVEKKETYLCKDSSYTFIEKDGGRDHHPEWRLYRRYYGHDDCSCWRGDRKPYETWKTFESKAELDVFCAANGISPVTITSDDWL